MPTRPTHRFIATYKGQLAGVVVMATPNAFSNLLGNKNKHLEKLISRGACISWSPKNLASSLIMYSIRWMVKQTEFRFFTAYSDTEARELGTIYQACNFTYLGQSSGAKFSYVDPEESKQSPFSDRLFRKTSFIRKKSIEAGIDWKAHWHQGDKINWNMIPSDMTSKIKTILKDYQESCHKRSIPPKHKYVYILGVNKTETKHLTALFNTLNPRLQNLEYPKIRGPISPKTLARPCRIVDQQLTTRPKPCWPLANDENSSSKKFYSIKEVSIMYGMSLWLLYSHAKTDPTFPIVNIGLKKKFVIDLIQFESWLDSRTKRFKQLSHNLPSASELLESK